MTQPPPSKRHEEKAREIVERCRDEHKECHVRIIAQALAAEREAALEEAAKICDENEAYCSRFGDHGAADICAGQIRALMKDDRG